MIYINSKSEKWLIVMCATEDDARILGFCGWHSLCCFEDMFGLNEYELFVKIPNNYCNVGYDEILFKYLVEGMNIKFRIGDEWIYTTTTGNAYYNSDCDEPGWEIETEAGVLSIENDIKILED